MGRVAKVCISAFMLGACLLIGCTSNQPYAGLDAFGDIPIAPQLESFWSAHGGLTTFGPPIEAAREDGHLLRQVFLNVELVVDRNSATSSVDLIPLGRTLGLAEPAVSPIGSSGSQYFSATGHILYTGFTQVYSALGAEPVVGAPISEVKFRQGLVLQYFENMGFYREENEAPSEVHLLAYGLASRPDRGMNMTQDVQYVLPPEILLRPFGDFMDRFGGEALFGPPLTEPFFTQDGAIEQIYERAAFYTSVRNSAQVQLRPLGESLGPAEAPVAPVEDPDALFFPETGHNVRWAFAAFYRTHQGEQILGLPLEESHIEGGVLVQRFQYGELTYHYDLPSHLAIQFAPLGLAYLESKEIGSVPPTPVASRSTPTANPHQAPLVVIVKTWPEKPMIPIGSSQWIWIEILLQDGMPWVNATPLVVVHGPRGDIYPIVPATSTEGKTSFILALDDLQPGEIVNYEVVVSGDYGIGYALGQFAAIWSTASP
ncbi:MAG TPA: hypothetical protein G4O08_05960 [Anaerolineae bacterium]|nr:hypothetical protein [Anaerolineae bacterium]